MESYLTVMATDKGTNVSIATNGKGLRGKLNKVVLAYSGGLDTSVIVPWLRYCYAHFICNSYLFFFIEIHLSRSWWLFRTFHKMLIDPCSGRFSS